MSLSAGYQTTPGRPMTTGEMRDIENFLDALRTRNTENTEKVEAWLEKNYKTFELDRRFHPSVFAEQSPNNAAKRVREFMTNKGDNEIYTEMIERLISYLEWRPWSGQDTPRLQRMVAEFFCGLFRRMLKSVVRTVRMERSTFVLATNALGYWAYESPDTDMQIIALYSIYLVSSENSVRRADGKLYPFLYQVMMSERSERSISLLVFAISVIGETINDGLDTYFSQSRANDEIDSFLVVTLLPTKLADVGIKHIPLYPLSEMATLCFCYIQPYFPVRLDESSKTKQIRIPLPLRLASSIFLRNLVLSTAYSHLLHTISIGFERGELFQTQLLGICASALTYEQYTKSAHKKQINGLLDSIYPRWREYVNNPHLRTGNMEKISPTPIGVIIDEMDAAGSIHDPDGFNFFATGSGGTNPNPEFSMMASNLIGFMTNIDKMFRRRVSSFIEGGDDYQSKLVRANTFTEGILRHVAWTGGLPDLAFAVLVGTYSLRHRDQLVPILWRNPESLWAIYAEGIADKRSGMTARRTHRSSDYIYCINRMEIEALKTTDLLGVVRLLYFGKALKKYGRERLFLSNDLLRMIWNFLKPSSSSPTSLPSLN